MSIRRIKLWKAACGLADDYDVEGTEPRVCYRHFVKEKPAKKMDMNDVDWVPTLNLNGEFNEGELEEEHHEQENKILNCSIDQQSNTETGGIVSYVSLEDETENPDLCTMIYDHETGDVLIVEPERNNDAESEEQEPQPIQMDFETKSPKKRKINSKKSLSDKKKPKILNRDAPKESDEEVEQDPITTVVTNNQCCQTDLTMDRINELEMFWTENGPPRKSTRSRKQQLKK